MVNFSQYVYLDDTSATGIRWAYAGGRGISKHFAGDVAGVVQQKQAYRIWIEGKFYKVHRVVYELYHGKQVPAEMVVDHIDGNPFNNSIDNLRAVTRKVNSRNMNMNSSNKTGVTGVSIDRKREGYTYAVAQWRDIDGNHKSKSFSFKVCGEEEAIRLASEYRKNIIKELNAIGAGYHENHGTRQLIPNHVCNNYNEGN